MNDAGPSDERLAGAAELVITGFRDKGLSLATCESITGGGIGWTLTRIAGASDVFRGGLITYASELKSTLAGVDAEFIAAHGVINRTTALEMAEGAAQVCAADVAVAVTGTAGPTGEDGEPPGTVWLGVCLDGHALAHRCAFPGERDAVRRWTVLACLNALGRLVSTPQRPVLDDALWDDLLTGE